MLAEAMAEAVQQRRVQEPVAEGLILQVGLGAADTADQAVDLAGPKADRVVVVDSTAAAEVEAEVADRVVVVVVHHWFRRVVPFLLGRTRAMDR
jgi:hypothetical protein